jgi:hypothetical protein
MTTVPHPTGGRRRELILLAALIGAILVVLAIRHEARPQQQQPPPLFGAQSAAAAYQMVIQHAGFPFHLPNAGGYQVMGSVPVGAGRNPVLGILYQSHRGIVQLLEGVQRNPDVLHILTTAPPSGVVVIDGRVWLRYGRDGVLGTTMPDGVTVAIQGAGWSQLEAFAKRIPAHAG